MLVRWAASCVPAMLVTSLRVQVSYVEDGSSGLTDGPWVTVVVTGPHVDLWHQF